MTDTLVIALVVGVPIIVALVSWIILDIVVKARKNKASEAIETLKQEDESSIEINKVRSLKKIATWVSAIAVILAIQFILGLLALLYFVFFFKFPSP